MGKKKKHKKALKKGFKIVKEILEIIALITSISATIYQAFKG